MHVCRYLILLLALLIVNTSFADVLEMKDGRRIEGEILFQNEMTVRIDAMISDIRAKLNFPKKDIAQIIEKELASDFFVRKDMVADKRLSDRSQFSPDDILYLHIPIQGKIGVDFDALGLARIIAYAKRHRIEHLVFTIDSSEGGDLDEANRIAKLLMMNQEKFVYHALVRKCQGDALAIAVPSDHLILLPGSIIGGLDRTMKKESGSLEDERVLRQQLGIEVASYLNSRGRPGHIVQAMIDPFLPLAAWMGQSGEPEFGERVPEGVEAKDVIFKSEDGISLKLKAEDAYKLGAPQFSGTVETYGPEMFDFKNWKLESAYASKIIHLTSKKRMLEAEKDQKRQLIKQKKFSSDVKRNIERRESTKRNLAYHMQQSKQFDPRKGSYSTYKVGGGSWGWRGRRYGGSYNTNRLTNESRAKWAQKSDLAAQHISHAIRAVQLMRKLEKEADRLGLENTYKPGELESIYAELAQALKLVKANRNRESK